MGAACLNRVDPTLWDPGLAGHWLSAMNAREFLPRIKCPVLMLQGDVELGGMVSDTAGEEGD